MGYTVHHLDSKTWLIEEEADCNVYMYLLAGDQKALLIDTGYGTIPLNEIVSSLTDLPVRVLCTHGHFDHIGGNVHFPTVMMHRGDLELCRQESNPSDTLCRVQWFDRSFTLDLGNRILEVFPVPGHTRGCVAVLDSKHRQLFTGDTCCKGPVLLHFDHSADLRSFRDSMLSILAMQDRFRITWPSHHAKPVGPDILQQFSEAANLLLDGFAQGTSASGDSVRIFEYRDISIIYRS